MLVGYLVHWRNSQRQFLIFLKDQFQFGSGSFLLKIETPFRFPLKNLRLVPVPVPVLEPTVRGNL